jgi:hypothetical protein
MSIYVEALIRGSIDEVWRRTQTPELHERWDLRFTSITYLERATSDGPQRFRYSRRIGPGLQIEGWGETSGERAADGTRTSSLSFGAEDRRSLIRVGSGYWKYQPVNEGVRFITGYDYQVRWGLAGRIVDRLLFRPLIGWATAWSFDRLRLWIEADIDPRDAARRAVVHALCAVMVAFVWVWHGLVPKLLGPHPDELALLMAAGVSADLSPALARIAGVAEVAFGVAFVPLARWRWPWLLTIALMLGATIGVLATSPDQVTAAFGPVTVNLQLAALAAVGLLSRRHLPSARHCRRSRPKNRSEEARS